MSKSCESEPITLAGEVRRIIDKPGVRVELRPLAALVMGLLHLRGGEMTVRQLEADVHAWEGIHGPANRQSVLRWADSHTKANDPLGQA